MFFAALFAMYFTIKSIDTGLHQPWPQATLDYPLATANTVVLILSSVTCQMGVFAVERGQIRRLGRIWDFRRWGLREWYVLSFIMGLYFVLGQGYEYLSLILREHVTISSSNYGSVFFLTTGFHGLHVSGGLNSVLLPLRRPPAGKLDNHAHPTTPILVSAYCQFCHFLLNWMFITTSLRSPTR